MLHSDRSLVHCLLASTNVVTRAVAKLWARTSNQVAEAAVCHAVAKARLELMREPWTQEQIEALPDGPKRRTQALLAVMGLVFPGTQAFYEGSGYLLFPSDSRGLLGTARPHPFGVMIQGKVMHIFVTSQDFNGAARGLNQVLLIFHRVHSDFRLVVHTLYTGIRPRAHLPLEKRWPLLVMPSLLAYWFVPVAGPGYSTHVEILHPTLTVEEAHLLPLPKNWREWLHHADLVGQRLRRIIPGTQPAQWLGFVPLGVAREKAADKRRCGHERQLKRERERLATRGKPKLRFAPPSEPTPELPPSASVAEIFIPEEAEGDPLL